MSRSSTASPLGEHALSTAEQALARRLSRFIASGSERPRILSLVDEAGAATEIELTPGLSRLLLDVLEPAGQGEAIGLIPLARMLTTQQAADILNVSRPFLVSLLDKGEIRHHVVGRHRRIRAADLYAYKARRDELRVQALRELAALDAEHL